MPRLSLEQQTLNTINDVRKAFGLRKLRAIRPGHTGDSTQCALTCSLKGIVVYTTQLDFALRDSASAVTAARVMNSDAHDAGVRLPSHVARFVAAFDNGRYPKLIKKGV
jgi:hypothetical protein